MLFFLFLTSLYITVIVMVIDCMYVVQVHPFPSSWLTNDLEGWEGGSRCYVVETNTPL